MTESSGLLRFSTEDLPDRDRVSRWREEFARGVVKMDVELLGDEPFRSESRIRILPDLKIWSCSVSASELTRTRSLAADGDDSLVLCIVKDGQTVVAQHNKEVLISRGEALLWSSEVAGVFHNPGILDIVTFAFPRQALARVAADLDKALMRVIPSTAGVLGLLSGYTEILQSDPAPMGAALLALVSSHVHDLAGLALGATHDAAEVAKSGGLRAARLHAIKADIIARLTQPDLTVDALAARHGISTRYIRALFDSEQTTFTDFVREHRLRRAHRMLSNPAFADRSISAIAFDCGFGDISYFSNIFRRRFGATPTDIRSTARRWAKDRDRDGNIGS